jgi:hypothetical protein
MGGCGSVGEVLEARGGREKYEGGRITRFEEAS